MNERGAAAALTLAHRFALRIFRLPVERGPPGTVAGRPEPCGEALAIASAFCGAGKGARK